MKAPEKIYICPSELAGIDYEEEWLERPFGDSVEYTRTDAFIEKACEFIKERLIFDDNVWYIEGELTIKDKVIEDFKNYMEGE